MLFAIDNYCCVAVFVQITGNITLPVRGSFTWPVAKSGGKIGNIEGCSRQVNIKISLNNLVKTGTDIGKCANFLGVIVNPVYLYGNHICN